MVVKLLGGDAHRIRARFHACDRAGAHLHEPSTAVHGAAAGECSDSCETAEEHADKSGGGVKVMEGALDPGEAFDLSRIDELYRAEIWGVDEDDEVARLALRAETETLGGLALYLR